MSTPQFPALGFLVLGILSIAASVIFVVRAAGCEATAERIWSAVAFGVMGIFWLVAYWSALRSTAH